MIIKLFEVSDDLDKLKWSLMFEMFPMEVSNSEDESEMYTEEFEKTGELKPE